MSRVIRIFCTLGCGILVLPTLLACREEPAEVHSEIVQAGLAEIISHQDPGCGTVVAYEFDNRFDYHVTCENGKKYRIHVGAEGHVNVNEHSDH